VRGVRRSYIGRGKRIAGAGHALGLLDAGEHAEHAGLHRAKLAGVDKEGFAHSSAGAVRRAAANIPASLIAGEEPETDGGSCGEEQLRGQRDDTVNKVGLDDLSADLALAADSLDPVQQFLFVSGGMRHTNTLPQYAIEPFR